MKITMNVDCTPDEARRFLGLPDVAPMQEAVMAEVQKQAMAALQAMEPETLLRTWLPAGIQGFEQLQKMFWNAMSGAAGGSKKGSE